MAIFNEKNSLFIRSRPKILGIGLILLHGSQLTNVQRYQGSTVKMVLSYKICSLNYANTCVALPNASRRSVRTLSVITTIMDHKVQL
jgi:hypothetical protein